MTVRSSRVVYCGCWKKYVIISLWFSNCSKSMSLRNGQARFEILISLQLTKSQLLASVSCWSLFQENRWAEGCPEILHCKLCQYIWLCVSNKAIPKPSIIELAGVSHNLLDHDRRTACTYKNIEYKDINYPCWNCIVCQEMRDKLHSRPWILLLLSSVLLSLCVSSILLPCCFCACYAFLHHIIVTTSK